MSLLRTATLAVLLSLPLLSHAGGKGIIGISIAVDGEGVFWNPTLKTVTIGKVVAGSPAAQAGLAEGDQIIEIEGKTVAGAKANDLQPHLQREVGQEVRMKVKKPSGEVKALTMTAVARPD